MRQCEMLEVCERGTMKKTLRLLLAFACALALCLCCAACGSKDDGKGDDAAGEDWRTSGDVYDHGTIVHDGSSVDVLVCIDSESAAFYWDDAEKVLYDSVKFPFSIPDAQADFGGIFFDDINGDDESDVVVDFYHDDGSETHLVWIWDDVERYVFQTDLSFAYSNEDDATSSLPFFEEYNLAVDGRMDDGTHLLSDGVSFYQGSDGFETGDAYWEVSLVNDVDYGSVREIEFNAYCYVPQSSAPTFSGQYDVSTDSELYDRYTGMWLTTSTTYVNGTEGGGENHYLHTVEWNGETYDIEFFYTAEWDFNASDWFAVLKKTYVVYLPEGYDGLVFAAEAQPIDREDLAIRMSLSDTCPEANLFGCDTVDPYRNLYFDVCA